MRLIKLALLVLASLAVAASAAASPAGAVPDTFFTYNAGMNGQREVPGPGQQTASGHARITVDTATGEICWELTVRRIEGTVIAAHIHIGARDTFGPIVQGLTPPVSGESSGCETNAPLATAIAADPSNYYVNVHSSLFQAGAVRGQLAGSHS